MTSAAKIHETITMMRRRVVEIDALIDQLEQRQFEQRRIPVTANGAAMQSVRRCRKRRQEG